MKNIYFTVGPSQTHPKLKEFMDRALLEDWPSLSHRSEKYMMLFSELSRNLKLFLKIPLDYSVFYSGCATEWMERSVQNCSSERTLHFSSGVFSHRFYEFSKEMGRNAKEVLCKEDFSFDLNDCPESFEPELVCLTHNETSSGVMLPKTFIEQLKQKYPKALFAIDIVSSVPFCKIDFSLFDVIFLSVQKGFGLPAGLGVVFVSPRALKKSCEIREGGRYTGFQHSFEHLQKAFEKNQTPETPNVLNMYLLNEVIKQMSIKGLDEIAKETEVKADLLFTAINESKFTEIVVKNSEFRSPTTIVAKTTKNSKEIIEQLKTKGLVVGAGYGKDKNKFIRIANFPSHSLEMVKNLADAVRNLND